MNKLTSFRYRLEKLILLGMESDNNKSIAMRIWQAGLFTCSLGFKSVLMLRNILYRLKICKVKQAPIPVICVGNITAGGNGKTPFVEMLARDLCKETRVIPFAIISRGYRGKGSCSTDVISPVDQYGRDVSPLYCGDEPYCLKKRLPDVDVLISHDRFLALEAAKIRGARWALLDDGFQMIKLKKDLSVVVLHATSWLGKHHFLPRGHLRDFPRHLKVADFLCITHIGKEPFEDMSQELAQYSSAKVMGARMRFLKVEGDQERSLDSLRGAKVGVFCGIANPQTYLQSLMKLGVVCVETLIELDHTVPSSIRWQAFTQQCLDKGAGLILCTEKDYVKMNKKSKGSLPVVYVRGQFEIIYGKQHYETLKNQIVDLIGGRS